MIGYWNGTSDEGYIWPQEIVSEKKISYKKKIISYLQKGFPVLHWMGYSGCRICCETLGSKCLSDGFWIWPEKLEHYVDKHNIRLPEEFVRHMIKRNWKVSFSVKKDLSTSRDYQTDSYWRSWCIENRCPDKRPDNLEVFSLPKRTGEGNVDLSLMCAMFSLIEGIDILVDTVELDKSSRLKGLEPAVDKFDDEIRLWSANILLNKPLVTISNQEYLYHSDLDGSKCRAMVAVKFVKRKPVFYCSLKAGVMNGQFREIKTLWCPELGKVD